MTSRLFRHTFHGVGPEFDPRWSDVIALIQGGGAAGNTFFEDRSPLGTAIVRRYGTAPNVGHTGGGAGTGPFPGTSAIQHNGSANGGLILAPPSGDSRFDFMRARGTVWSERLTLDGWVKHAGSSRALVWLLPGNQLDNLMGGTTGAVWALNATVSGANTTISALVTTTVVPSSGPLSYSTRAFSLPATPIAAGAWVYWWFQWDGPTSTARLRAHVLGAGDIGNTVYTWPETAKGALTGAAGERFPDGRTIVTGEGRLAFLVGATGHESTSANVSTLFNFRATKALRPYAAPSGPFYAAEGTPNNSGQGGSASVGQVELTHLQNWVVPAGVTHISAVCVGVKLSIGSVDQVAATWPVLGDGGGQGGTGGAGRSETVYPPPRGSFGGGPSTPPPGTTYNYPGGGGGAGGYGGKGGDGFRSGAYNGWGQQGGGGGGYSGQRGGHVGLKGRGDSGYPTTNGPGTTGSPGGTAVGGGAGGVVAGDGVDGNHLAWRNAIPVTPGQTVLCTYIGQPGGTGAARIMWGDDRSYPDDAGDVTL